jgi:preprotein translocase subunit YajC
MTAPLLMAATPASDTSAIFIGILPWLLIFVIFYLLMIRPQQKRM